MIRRESAQHFAWQMEAPYVRSGALANSWVNYHEWSNTATDTYRDAGCWADSFGMVHMEGLIKNGSLTSQFFMLPRHMFPSKQHLLPAMSGLNEYTRVDVMEGATLGPRLVTGGTTWLTLDQLRWSITNRDWISLTAEAEYATYWVDYNPGAGSSLYCEGGYKKDPLGFVHLRGMVKRPTGSGTTIFTLPVGYRPEKNLIFNAESADISGHGELEIGSDGTVTINHGNQNNWFSLGSIYFMSGTSPYWKEWTPVNYTNGFTDWSDTDYQGAVEWVAPDGMYHVMGLAENVDDVTTGNVYVAPSYVVDRMGNNIHMFLCATDFTSTGPSKLGCNFFGATGYASIMADYSGVGDRWVSLSGNSIRLLQVPI